MPNSWNPETYRLRAAAWQEEADRYSAGDRQDISLAIAEGYARLAQLIEERAAFLASATGPGAALAIQ